MATMNGIVVAKDGSPIDDAVVAIDDGEPFAACVISGSDGRFTAVVTDKSIHRVSVEKEGFKPLKQTVGIGGQFEPRFTLESTKPQPVEPILQFFGYAHLAPKMQEVSRPFCELAKSLVDPSSLSVLPRNPERTVALRKLLEAKDAAVRAAIFKNE